MSAVFDAPGASIPESLGKHRIVGKLATGGMATVYLARLVGPANFENLVVIKRMLPHLAEDERFRAMFADEARTVAKIRHPNVVRTFELVDEGHELYLVMEYLEGETLQRLSHVMATNKKRLSLALVCHVVAEAAAGLHAAHELKDDDGQPLAVVHRDVSPHNLFVAFDGSVKVIDFGIAKSIDRANQTSTGELKGKFAYMSPEQVAGLPTTRRTDVFALGVVLWELLSWKRLFARENQLVTLRAVADEPTPPPSSFNPDIPAILDGICAKCLAKEPDQRYATMADLRRDLLTYLRTEGATDPQTELAGIMQGLFETSIAQRTAMVRASRRDDEPRKALEPSGSRIRTDDTRRPALPVRSVEPSSIEVTLDEVPPAASVASAPRSRAPMFAGAALTVVVLVAGIAWAAWPAPPTAPVPAPPTSLPVVATPEPEVASEPIAAPVLAAERVSVTIESDPEGALVTIDGIARGNAPVTVTFARGDEPLALELTAPGRRATSTRFVPDHDQTLRLSLARAGGGRTAPREETPDERGGFFAFE